MLNPDTLLKAMDAATVAAADTGFRKHLGASLIGRECDRYLGYVFRWCHAEDFPARMLRLFERGQLEEQRFVKLLSLVGGTVYEADPETGKQWRISDIDGHFGGSCDGVVVDIPELEANQACVTEMKTHGEDSYAKLAGKLISKSPYKREFNALKNGLRNSKPEHYIQLQIYMHKLRIDVGLYMAVNKNTDEIYLEFVQINHELAERMIARAGRIIKYKELFSKLSNSPGWGACKFCPMTGICHGKEKPEINCRTCWHSNPGPEGTWTCGKGNSADIATQRGCAQHLFNPYLLNIVRVENGNAAEGWLTLLLKDGRIVTTGPNHVTSQQLTL